MQSIAIHQDPVDRFFRVASVRAHTVAGPVSGRIRAIDRDDALAVFADTEHAASRGGRRRSNAPVGPMSAARSARLTVGVIGAGRVGPVLGAALAGAGHLLTGITHGSDDDRVEAILPGIVVRDAVELARVSQLVVVAVPHAELPGLVAGLAELEAWQPGSLVLHTDPAFGPGCSRPPRPAVRSPLAVHPAISFTGTSIDLRQLTAAYAAVTAPAPVLPIAQALAVELGCEPVVVAEEDRPATPRRSRPRDRVLAVDRAPVHRHPRRSRFR